MKKIVLILSLIVFNACSASSLKLPEILKPTKIHKPDIVHSTFKRTGPTIQIGLLLDTSGSMDGLLQQAKDQLWDIVNEVTYANKDNQDVTIQVGIFEYGKDSLPKYEGYLQMILPLSEDLDDVSQKLNALYTNGGDEYAGKVILEAVNRFAWSDHPDDLKLLIIAGNEPFTQGDVPYQKAIEKAVKNNIIVNTIFCGNYDEGVQSKWYDGSKIGNGKYFNINQNDKAVEIPTPYDDDIIALGEQLNDTYIYYGANNYARKTKMMEQDAVAASNSKSSFISRSIVKSKAQYSSKKYELGSAMKADTKMLNTLDKEALPVELQNKSKKEIAKIVKEKTDKRVAIQEKLKKLEDKRKTFIKEKTSKSKANLGNAIIQSIRDQASQNGFKFKN